MVRFISCDWGTSSFRLRLINTADLKVVCEVKNQMGTAVVHKQFLELKENQQVERELFFKQFITRGVASLEEVLKEDLSSLMIICSGMVTSSIGLREVPFTQLPIAISGKNIMMDFVGASAEFSHPLLLLSGLRSDRDVMRGEESELVGVIHMLDGFSGDGLFVFPGTHSKHIRVSGYQISDFTTYMTGEFFEMLTQHSILTGSVSGVAPFDFVKFGEAFKQGVLDGKGRSLLSQAFLVRTRSLLDSVEKTANYHYLSGLLIGNELTALCHCDDVPIYMCCNSHLDAQYKIALDTLDIPAVHISSAIMDQAVVQGHYKIYNQNLNHERSIFLGSF